jgi:hypothetical protein
VAFPLVWQFPAAGDTGTDATCTTHATTTCGTTPTGFATSTASRARRTATTRTAYTSLLTLTAPTNTTNFPGCAYTTGTGTVSSLFATKGTNPLSAHSTGNTDNTTNTQTGDVTRSSKGYAGGTTTEPDCSSTGTYTSLVSHATLPSHRRTEPATQTTTTDLTFAHPTCSLTPTDSRTMGNQKETAFALGTTTTSSSSSTTTTTTTTTTTGTSGPHLNTDYYLPPPDHA